MVSREATLFKRELFAVIAGPAVLAGIIWLPAWVAGSIIALVILVAGDELFRMARVSGLEAGRFGPGLALAILLAMGLFRGPAGLAAGMAAVILVMPAWRLAHPRAPRGALAGSAVEVFGILYIGLTGASVLWLRTQPAVDSTGIRLLIFFLITIWIGDSGAYYVGKNLGRHKMAPVLSPKKTWEGFAGGVAATIGSAAVFQAVVPLPYSWPQVLGLAGILAVTAPIGDLVVSLYKRDTGVKDSAELIPGHGGLLDRTDSLLFSAPPALLYLFLLGLLNR